MHTDPLRFIHGLSPSDIPPNVLQGAKRSLLDLLGVAAGGLGTQLSRIIRDHAAEDMPGQTPLLFDARRANPAAAAMAAGMTIDSLDGHDGFNPAKGHIGCPLVPAMLSLAPENCSGADFLATMVMGYEMGARMAMTQHATAPDYHTSGSWGAVAGAAAGARLLGLGHEATRHALGIAEYHGPRSQMMRCIDFPTNVKDGSGWGALCGVSAVQLARRGFTGAPAITVEDAPEFWGDLGTRWYMLEQYFKPYPVCRWAQAPIEATLSLRRSHGLTATDVRALELETFHESVRLHVQNPQGTDAAQYSTSFPCALALVYGDVQAKHLGDDAIANPAVLRLSNATTMVENAHANAEFPLTRLARVRLQLQDGTWLQSDWHTPRWDWQDPPSDADLRAKFDGFAIPVLGASKAAALAQVIATLDTRPLADLRALLGQPSS